MTIKFQKSDFHDLRNNRYPHLASMNYSDQELEVIDHLRQLSELLESGGIGFEWFSGHVQDELRRVGWSTAP